MNKRVGCEVAASSDFSSNLNLSKFSFVHSSLSLCRSVERPSPVSELRILFLDLFCLPLEQCDQLVVGRDVVIVLFELSPFDRFDLPRFLLVDLKLFDTVDQSGVGAAAKLMQALVLV